MKPYYQDASVKIYHADCREMLAAMKPGSVDLVLTDPPYGIGADQNLRANKQGGQAVAPSKDYGAEQWDCRPDDATIELVLSVGKQAIIWGGNYFGLRPQSCWLVWDKDNGNNNYADCELAWTNLPGAVRKRRYRWMGMLQEHGGRHKEPRLHAAQKPLPIMHWCLELVPDAQTILDPFMGSGTTLRAAKDLGRKAIGIEIEERYCEIAAKRMEQSTLGIDL